MANAPTVALLLVEYDGPITESTAAALETAMSDGEGVKSVHATILTSEEATGVRMTHP